MMLGSDMVATFRSSLEQTLDDTKQRLSGCVCRKQSIGTSSVVLRNFAQFAQRFRVTLAIYGEFPY